MDSLASKEGCGVRVVVWSPTREKIGRVVQFNFQATNNAVEYETLLVGIRLVRALGSTRIRLYTNSQLVANQVQGEFVSKEDYMAAYVARARTALEQIDD